MLEILIVTLVVSLLAGIALLGFNINNPQRNLEREAERLRLVLSLAVDQALVRGTEYGLYLGRKEYQILKFNGQELQWQQSEAPVFQLHRLADSVELVLEMEDRPVLPVEVIDGGTNSGEVRYETPELIPQVQMYSSGELTPFDIFLDVVGGSMMYRISGDGIRPIRLEKVGHAG